MITYGQPVTTLATSVADLRYPTRTSLALGGLTNWRSSLAGRVWSPARIVAVGSSTTDGAASTVQSRRYIELLGQMLHTRYNPAGVAGGTLYRASGEGLGTTGTTAVVSQGIAVRSLSMSAAATLTLSGITSTAFTVLYAQGPSAGAFTVAIDGGAATTVTPSTTGSARNDGTWTSGALTAGSHSIVITATAATIIEGIYAHQGDTASGVQVYNSGLSGATTTTFATDTTLAKRIGQLAPGLVTIMLGSNDYQSGMTPATFQSNLQSIIAQYKAGLSAAGALPASFLLIGTYQRLDVTSPAYPWSSYVNAMNVVAAADPANVAFIDISANYPAANTTTGDPWDLLYSDSIHQTDRGHGYMADVLFAALTPQVFSPPPALDVTPPTAPTGLTLSVAGGYNQVAASWTAATDDRLVTGYNVYRDGTLVATVTAASFTDTGISAVSHSYQVSAIDAAGNESAKTSAATATPTAQTILAADTFTRANSSTLGTAETGGTWTEAGTTWPIVSNQATSSGAGVAFVNVGTGNVDVAVDLTLGGGVLGIAFRATDINNRLGCVLDASTGAVTFFKTASGSTSSLATAATASVTTGTTRRLRVVASGSTLTSYLDGVQLQTLTLSGGDQTTFGSAGGVGFRCSTSNSANRWDNFQVLAA